MDIDFTSVNSPNSTVVEDHSYLVRDGKHLYCARYNPSSKPMAGVVLCSPFAEEKIRTHRIYVSFARAVASLGATAVLFDYFGDGDSEGNFKEASFDDRIADIKAVYENVKQTLSLQKMALLGLRWGATLATISSEELKPDALVLWEPIVDTEKYFYNHLRSHLASQMLVEGKVTRKRDELIEDLKNGQTLMVEGYRLTGDFYFAACEHGLKNITLSHSPETLITQISPKPDKIKPELENLAEALTNCNVAGVPREFEWEKTETWQPAPPQLFNLTLEYLDKNGFFRRDT